MSDEPFTLSYNRQANASVYIIWLIEAGDFGPIMFFVALNMTILESYWLLLWTVFGFVMYVIALRAGRPKGYDRHMIETWAAPRGYLRPGHSEAQHHIRPPKGPTS